MTQNAYAEGSTYPAIKDDKILRLYSMRFCPYAQRTRLVLAHLNIPHETVNINLKSKPDWFFTKNPLGLVPVLEQGNKIVYESAVCDEYLEDVYGHKKLLSGDPYVKARTRILMESCGKVTDKFYGMLRLTTEEEKKKAVDDMAKPLKIFEDGIQGKFFGGNEPSMLDFHIWPWFERMPVLARLIGVNVLPADQFPRLTAWVSAMNELPAVKATIHPVDLHIEFMKPYLTGGTVNYDIGLTAH